MSAWIVVAVFPKIRSKLPSNVWQPHRGEVRVPGTDRIVIADRHEGIDEYGLACGDPGDLELIRRSEIVVGVGIPPHGRKNHLRRRPSAQGSEVEERVRAPQDHRLAVSREELRLRDSWAQINELDSQNIWSSLLERLARRKRRGHREGGGAR